MPTFQPNGIGDVATKATKEVPSFSKNFNGSDNLCPNAEGNRFAPLSNDIPNFMNIGKEEPIKEKNGAELVGATECRFNPSVIERAPIDSVKITQTAEIIKDRKEFLPQNWGRLTENEKVSVLQETENEIAEVSHRPACVIHSEDLKPGLAGYHNNDGITISSEALDNNSPEGIREVLDTLLHEGRHEYQTYNVNQLIHGDVPVEPTQSLVESWRINLQDLGYKNGDCSMWDFRQIGFKEYLAQPIEVDARVFAESVLNQTSIA